MMITKEIAVFLSEIGIGTFDETGLTGDIFINALPDQPDESISIYSTGGMASDQKREYDRVSIQVLIRSIPNNAKAAEEKAQAVIDVMAGFNSDYFADGGHYIFDTSALQAGPNNIGPDENRRFEFSQNFVVEYQK